MRKVIFADDDAIVRKYLAEAIDWHSLGFETYGAVSTGKDALALILREQPELAIVDIDMPEMDGVEVLRALQENGGADRTKVLVLSCYNDFEYVKNAMRYGAVDYLLKHKTDSTMIADLVGSVFEGAAQPELKLNKHTVHHETSLESGTVSEVDPNHAGSDNLREAIAHLMRQGFCLDTTNMLLAWGQIDHYDKFMLRNSEDAITQLHTLFLNIVQECLDGVDDAVCIPGEMGVTVLFGGGTAMPQAVERLGEILRQVGDALHMSATFGLAQPGVNLDNLNIRREQAVISLRYRLYTGANRVIEYGDVVFQEGFPRTLSEKTDAWAETMFSDPGSGMLLKSIFEEARRARLPYHTFNLLLMKMLGALLNQAEDISSISRTFQDLNPKLIFLGCDTCDDFCAWFEKKVNSLRPSEHRVFRSEIVKAMSYIESHLEEALSLSAIAEHVNFSKNYFSQLFKQTTGESVVDYITRLRIGRAKEMLINPNYKVYEVALQTGFESQHYFNRLFKSLEGVTPTEYRFNHCYK